MFWRRIADQIPAESNVAAIANSTVHNASPDINRGQNASTRSARGPNTCTETNEAAAHWGRAGADDLGGESACARGESVMPGVVLLLYRPGICHGLPPINVRIVVARISRNPRINGTRGTTDTIDRSLCHTSATIS